METTRAPALPPPGHYQIDTAASRVTFRTRHMFGLGAVSGSFAIRAGTVDVTEAPDGASVRAQIDAASFDTGHGRRDATVRSARLLDAERHPVITFTCSGVKWPELVGTLTVHEVSRAVTLAMEGCAVTQDAFTARASTRVDRTEFGVTAYRGLAARYLRMTVDVRCVRQ